MICSTCQRESPTGLRCQCDRLHCPACYRLHQCQADKPLWPHQERGLADLESAIAEGEKAICVTSPTGGGKSRLASEFIARRAKESKNIVLLTHRKLLTHQWGKEVLAEADLDFGIMAAGYPPELTKSIQLASVWTIASRVLQRETWSLPPADYVLIDEIHAVTGATMQEIVRRYREMGAVVICMTATPVGVKIFCTRLIVAGTNSELRKCGALVPCHTYAPDEPDLCHVRKIKVGEDPSEETARKAIMVQGVFGRIYDNWRLLNTDAKPTILFGPCVASSRWLCEQFNKKGVKAAHMDAETPDNEREDIIEGSKDGSIKVVCNRYVCREGLDMPWLAHCVLATVFGQLSSYIQAPGRILRAFPGLDHVTIQDHGGNFHKPGFGSLNDDREWSLDDTDVSIAQWHHKQRQKGEESEPIVCPRCHAVRRMGPRCLVCGHEHTKSVRCVIQSDGSLKRQVGLVTKHKRQRSDQEKQAAGLFYAAANSRMTVAQLSGLYYRKYGENFPDGVLRTAGGPVVLPTPASVDWDRRVGAVFPGAVRRKKQLV